MTVQDYWNIAHCHWSNVFFINFHKWKYSIVFQLLAFWFLHYQSKGSSKFHWRFNISLILVIYKYKTLHYKMFDLLWKSTTVQWKKKSVILKIILMIYSHIHVSSKPLPWGLNKFQMSPYHIMHKWMLFFIINFKIYIYTHVMCENYIEYYFIPPDT